jgi:hypothetical protein
MKYAQQTEVTSDKSRSEIERTLARYGARKFVYGWDDGRAMVQFEAHDRRIRFILPLPTIEDVKHTPSGRVRSARTWPAMRDQATRQRWRALLLCIKAKLESVDSGIEEFDEAFMAQIVLPNGATVGDQIKPEIGSAYAGGRFSPFLLPAGGAQ